MPLPKKQPPGINDNAHPYNRLDLLGAYLSLICLAHCTLFPLLPLLLIGLPWLADEKLHLMMLLLIAPVAILAFFRGNQCHGKKSVPIWGAGALLLLLIGSISPENLEKPLTVIGSLMLGFTHLLNRKLLLRA